MEYNYINGDEHRLDWGSDIEHSDEDIGRISPALSYTSDDEAEVLDFNPNNFVLIGERAECEVSPRFGLTARCFFMTFRDVANIPDVEAVARAGIAEVLRRAFATCGENDLVGVQIEHPALDSEILVHFGDVESTTAENVLHTISSVQQSKRELTFDEDMIIKITSISPPNGRGYVKLARGRFEEIFKKNSKGYTSIFIEIRNKDWLCFPRSVVTGIAHIKRLRFGDTSVKWDQIRKGDKYRLQKDMASDLMLRAGVLGLGRRTCGIPEFKKIQKIITEDGFQLKVFSHNHFDALIFDEELEGLIPVYIYHYDKHFCPMSTPRILTGTNFYCDG